MATLAEKRRQKLKDKNLINPKTYVTASEYPDAEARKAEVNRRVQEEQERLKQDQKKKQGDADSAVQTKEGTNTLSPNQQNKAKKVADLIFHVKNLQDIHTKAENIKSDSCTKEVLQNTQDILFKTSGLNDFGDADSDSGKKSPLLSSEYAEIQLCDFDSEDAVVTKCFPGKSQRNGNGIKKFIKDSPDCENAHKFFHYPDDNPDLHQKLKIMAQAFYAKAGELSENDIPQQINKFCSIEGMVNTPAGQELCSGFDLSSLSDFISQ